MVTSTAPTSLWLNLPPPLAGLDSLLEPTGNIKVAHEKAARAFGCQQLFFGTNGTSTSNKIAVQAIVRPGDIVLVDRNCHKSHHYGLVLCGGQPFYVEAYPLTEYSMYGAVPLRTIKKALLDLKAEGKLDRVRMLLLTNCTFDGHVYNVQRFMEEVLAIKPDIVFLWDEAWYAYNRFSQFHRMRSAMGACEALRENAMPARPTELSITSSRRSTVKLTRRSTSNYSTRICCPIRTR